MGGFSKAYAMTGWRVGYVCAPAGDPRGDRQGPPVRDHVGARRRPRTRPWSRSRTAEADVEAMRAEYDRRRRLVVDGLNAIGLDTFEPRGAFYAFPRITSTGLDDEAFVERLLAEEHVAAVPGSAFGPSGAGPRADVLRDELREARGGARADRALRGPDAGREARLAQDHVDPHRGRARRRQRDDGARQGSTVDDEGDGGAGLSRRALMS